MPKVIEEIAAVFSGSMIRPMAATFVTRSGGICRYSIDVSDKVRLRVRWMKQSRQFVGLPIFMNARIWSVNSVSLVPMALPSDMWLCVLRKALVGQRCALHGGQLRTHEVVPEIVELLFR